MGNKMKYDPRPGYIVVKQLNDTTASGIHISSEKKYTNHGVVVAVGDVEDNYTLDTHIYFLNQAHEIIHDEDNIYHFVPIDHVAFMRI